MTAHSMKLISHQGTRVFAPENTIAGYEIAARMGYYALNFAVVRASREGTLYIMHDPTVDRTTNGTGAVAELSDAELDRLLVVRREDYAEYDIVSFPPDSLHVPTLKDGLAICRRYGILPMIRLGIEPEGNDRAFDNLHALIREHVPDGRFLLSGSARTMEFLDAFYPDTVKIVYFGDRDATSAVSYMDAFSFRHRGTVSIMLRPQYLTAEGIRLLRVSGYIPYSANPGDMRDSETAARTYARLAADGCVFANAERLTEY